jgi:hypothetical protein
MADFVAKVAADKLQNKNTQQTDHGAWIFEST